MAKWIYNKSGTEKTYLNVPIANGVYYQIPSNVLSNYQQNTALLSDLVSGAVSMSSTGNSELPGSVSDQVDFLKGVDLSPRDSAGLPLVNTNNPPFGSKILPDGKKLLRRVRGTSAAVTAGSNNIDFEVPFTNCKITGVQVLNGIMGDKASFQVLDTATGTVSGVPNYLLNTFGTDVYIAPEKAEYPSKYDADLIAGLVLRIVYNTSDSRTVYINYDLHEVVNP